MTSRLQPITETAERKSRIMTLDVLRGTAILGMLCMNIPEMGYNIDDFISKPFQGWTTAEQGLFWFREMIIEGNSRTLFTMLFGASFMILIAGAMQPEDPLRNAELYLRRCAWMAVFGVLHATILLWPGDLLLHYALPGALLFLFRNWNPRPLLVIVAAGICLLSILEAREDYKNAAIYSGVKPVLAKQAQGLVLSEQEEAEVETWTAIVSARTVDRDEWAKEKEIRQSYWRSLVFMTKYWWSQFDFDVAVWGLEALIFMMFGMALFKLGIINGLRPIRFYLWMTAIGFAIAVPLNAHEAWLKWSSMDAPQIWQDDITYQLSRTAMAVGIIGIVITTLKTNIGPWLLYPVACAGRMALTNYMGQSLIAATLFTGFGLFARLDGFGLLALAVAIWLSQVLFSMWWFTRFRIGPLEWVWRVLIHWENQPIRNPGGQLAGQQSPIP